MFDNYKVYMHINKINNKKYIGITKQKVENRWKNGKAYYKRGIFYLAIKKYGWENFEHIVLFENLTKEEAEQKEIELIAKYKTNQKGFGYNIEGGGNANKEVSEETRKKLSDVNDRRWLGKHLPQEMKLKISETKKGKRYGNALYNMKKINQYDLNGNFIKSFNSMSEAQNELGIKYQNISMCCRDLIHKTHGYVFKYIDNQGQ